MDDRICPKSEHPCVSDSSGIPRFLFGQDYWGETPSETMRDLLSRAEKTHWRSSLEAIRGEAVAEHLLSPIRADFLHAMPWHKIRKVLDVGAGMGFMSCDMAPYAESVVSLEAVPERARFIQIRARQDQLRVFPVIASAMDMPFAPESFDLITLNGVFEYIGLWGRGDPETLQRKFLRASLRLLRPGGYLYVGIETRLSMSAFLGGMDHSGLQYTSLMPRRIADWYCRLRAKPVYGAERPAIGYRTYTHTPAKYARLFRDAGFEKSIVYGVYDGYNRQKAVYRLDDFAGRNIVLRKINPPASIAGRLRRLVEDNRFLYRILEREVLIFARKGHLETGAADMPWAELVQPDETVVQISLPSKILGIVCQGGAPRGVLEIAKKDSDEAAARLKASYRTLTHLESAAHGATKLPMRWPKPVTELEMAGRTVWRYEYVSGPSLATLLLPSMYSEGEVLPLLSRAIDAYIALSTWMSSIRNSVSPREEWAQFEMKIAQTPMSQDIRDDVRAAIHAARKEEWRLNTVHGDFTAGNLLISESNELVLTDWEHFTTHLPVGVDLIRFHQDVLMEAKRLSKRNYQRLRCNLGTVIENVLSSQGYTKTALRHLNALYIGHQILALGGEKYAYAPLVNAYRASCT